jgi:hypothetical protein
MAEGVRDKMLCYSDSQCGTGSTHACNSSIQYYIAQSLSYCVRDRW